MGTMRASVTALGSTGMAQARSETRPPREGRESNPAKLTAELVDAGESLVGALDAAGAGPDTAFWLWFRDVSGWRLVLDGGRLVKHGSKIAQSRIRRLLDESDRFDPLTMSHVGVAKRRARVVQTLRSALRTGPGIHGVRIHDNVLNGVRVQSAYVYRII
jgi:hypothetical protein